jgi:hypothetical protein
MIDDVLSRAVLEGAGPRLAAGLDSEADSPVVAKGRGRDLRDRSASTAGSHDGRCVGLLT